MIRKMRREKKVFLFLDVVSGRNQLFSLYLSHFVLRLVIRGLFDLLVSNECSTERRITLS